MGWQSRGLNAPTYPEPGISLRVSVDIHGELSARLPVKQKPKVTTETGQKRGTLERNTPQGKERRKPELTRGSPTMG